MTQLRAPLVKRQENPADDLPLVREGPANPNY